MRKLIVALMTAGLATGVANAATVYSNDFSTDANGFSGGGTRQTSPSGEAYYALLQQTGTLTLDTSAYIGQQLTLSFSLYGIGSVDGDGQYGGGPDPFVVSVDGNSIFNYNFANFNGNTQNYPTAGSAALTGSVSNGTLGYSGFPGSVQDSIYNLTLTAFTVTNASTLISFRDGTNEGVGNEYYGIDKVLVTGDRNATSAAPEPASWALMVGGFGLIGGAMRRRQRTLVRFA